MRRGWRIASETHLISACFVSVTAVLISFSHAIRTITAHHYYGRPKYIYWSTQIIIHIIWQSIWTTSHLSSGQPEFHPVRQHRWIARPSQLDSDHETFVQLPLPLCSSAVEPHTPPPFSQALSSCWPAECYPALVTIQGGTAVEERERGREIEREREGGRGRDGKDRHKPLRNSSAFLSNSSHHLTGRLCWLAVLPRLPHTTAYKTEVTYTAA